MDRITDRLRALADEKYREFHSGLIPTVDKNSIIGVRIPEIRKLAKSLSEDDRREFIGILPHRYYDENVLHAAIISDIRGFGDALEQTERFLPFVDNWAVCDLLNPKAFPKNRETVLPRIYEWLGSERTYTVRFGIVTLMRNYLDGDFKEEYPERVAMIRSEEFYINMAIAWYFATALAKQWDSAVKYVEERRLPDWTHRKTIQKACESFRITDEQKSYLRSLR